MAAGTTDNSHIDYDTLKKANGSPGVFARQNRLLLRFPFCSRSASTEYQGKLKSLQKELETKFRKINTYKIVVSGGGVCISISPPTPSTQSSHPRIHTSRHKTKGGFEVDHLSVSCRLLHENRSSAFKFMAL